MIGGRSALLSAASGLGYGNWEGNYSDVSLLLRNGTPALAPADESPTPKTITAVGNASATTAIAKWNQGSGGMSLVFDGSGDYLSIASNADFAFAGDFTVEAWVYLISAPSDNLDAFWLTDFRNANASNLGFVFGVRTVNGSLVIYGGGFGAEANGSANIALATWNHLAYVRSGSTVTMYLNGVSQGSFTSSFSQAATPLIIGARFNTLTEYWNGYIDDLRITKGVARYTSNFTPPTTELPANITDDPDYNSVSLLLRGNETPALIPVDESPTPKAITAFGNAGISTTTFKYGDSSLVFDGSDDRLTLAASSAWDFSGGPHTIECWLWLNAYPSVNCRFLQAGPNNSTSSFCLFIITPGGFLSSGRPSLGSTGLSFPTAIPLNQWVHLALVMNSAGATLLAVNGVSVTASVILPTGTTSNVLYIGQDPTVESGDNAVLNGYIDDLRITKGVARYTKNFLPPPAELPAI